jgi:hypothetical protein
MGFLSYTLYSFPVVVVLLGLGVSYLASILSTSYKASEAFPLTCCQSSAFSSGSTAHIFFPYQLGDDLMEEVECLFDTEPSEWFTDVLTSSLLVQSRFVSEHGPPTQRARARIQTQLSEDDLFRWLSSVESNKILSLVSTELARFMSFVSCFILLLF